MKAKRPRGVTFLAVGVLMIAALFISRLVQAILYWDELNGLVLRVHPLYLIVTGLVFGAAGLPMIWGLWLGRAWVVRRFQIFLGALVFYYWLDRIFLTASKAAQGNWPFAAAITVAMTAWVIWLFSRPGTKLFFANDAEIGEGDDE